MPRCTKLGDWRALPFEEAFFARSRRAGSHRLPRQMPHKVLDARLPAMVAHIIGFVLQNLPALLFVVALLVEVATGLSSSGSYNVSMRHLRYH